MKWRTNGRCHQGQGHRHPRSLRRLLMVLFAVTMVVAALIAGVGGHLLRPSRTAHFDSIRDFIAARFEERWDQPEARAALAREIETRMNAEVFIELANTPTAEPAETAQAADHTAFRRPYRIPVMQDGERVGVVVISLPPPPFLLEGIAFIAIFMLVLWWSSGLLARWLARPLEHVADVVSQIGAGAYDARLTTPRHAPEELRNMANAINEMASRIERAANDQKMLIASVSHEIRTPLGHARLLIDLARDEGIDDELAENLEKEILEVDDLVGQLLAGSKLDAIGPERHTIDIADATARALERAGEDPHKSDCEQAIACEADPTLLARALANLIRNAKEHGGGLKSIHVRAYEETLEFRFEDHGKGLSPEALARWVKPFARDGSDSAGSLGLGLTLCNRIAIAHGGGLESRPSASGYQLVLTLPLHATASV